MHCNFMHVCNQMQLFEKEEVAEKYQSMLQDARKELQREMKTHEQELVSLRAKLHSQEDEYVAKLKAQALEAARTPVAILPSDSQLERLLVLEELTSSQEEEIMKYKLQFEANGRENRIKERTHEATVKKMQIEANDSSRRYQVEVEGIKKNSCAHAEISLKGEVIIRE